ncbi:MAG: hypothetical protein QOF02_263 [Blastocatellia bacterium]|jgi:hypothetical protein|nr:hypothetical protein [Blastocatellia bacterium]
MRNEEQAAFIRGKVVAVCEGLLNEEIGVIASARMLCRLEYELSRREGGWHEHDEDFITFVAINSETDHLPVDDERRNWSDEALERKDEEIAKAESGYREMACAACRKLIARFEMKDS